MTSWLNRKSAKLSEVKVGWRCESVDPCEVCLGYLYGKHIDSMIFHNRCRKPKARPGRTLEQSRDRIRLTSISAFSIIPAYSPILCIEGVFNVGHTHSQATASDQESRSSDHIQSPSNHPQCHPIPSPLLMRSPRTSSLSLSTPQSPTPPLFESLSKSSAKSVTTSAIKAATVLSLP